MKKNISREYIKIIKLLDNDEVFVKAFYLIPFSYLSLFVPKRYLILRTEYLKKVGKL